MLIRLYFAYIFALLLTLTSVNSYGDIPQATQEQVRAFRNEAASHRLRNSEIIFRLMSDENFMARFPEFRELRPQMPQVINTVLRHDSLKNDLPDRHPVIQTLAANLGTDYRSLPVDSPTRLNMEKQIQVLNMFDDANWDNIIRRQFPNKKHQELLTDLMKAVDWHDTAEARRKEFENKQGQLKRDWLSSKEWILTRGKELNLTPSQQKVMAPWAEYLETSFKPQYQEIKAKYPVEGIPAEKFQSHATELVARSKSTLPVNSGIGLKKENPHSSTKLGSSVVSTIAGVGKTVGGGVVISSVGSFYSYLSEPRAFEVKSIAEDAAPYAGGLSDCQTRKCAKFMEDCDEQIKTYKARVH